MKEEYMTPSERYVAALNLEQPDRVPLTPLISMGFAATYYRLKTGEMHKTPTKGLDVMI